MIEASSINQVQQPLNWLVTDRPVDLLIIGGGVNGCGIARDAIGRGLSVVLCEKSDLASATSSASTKLFHGGLRYLEHYKFRLVQEALVEREVLLKAMPHISWPLRFVLPYHNGLRPRWMLRAGLFLYDHLGGRKILPAAKAINLRQHVAGAALKKSYVHGFEYSDCWVEDARLVALNARDAANRGAHIFTRTECLSAERVNDFWLVRLRNNISGEVYQQLCRGIVNAAGPWVEQVLNTCLQQNSEARVRLVRGSHIVTKRLFNHDHPYIFQQTDGRIVFAIPYETDFTLIGTTDLDHHEDPACARCSEAEQDYLLAAAGEYFAQTLSAQDIVWSYSGVRPLYDDHANSAAAATREYVLTHNDVDGKTPLLNVFGGKITTYRKLAETVLAKLGEYYPAMGRAWTAGVALPGGDFEVGGLERLVDQLMTRYPFINKLWALRLIRAYGTEAREMLGAARSEAALGEHFGWNLTEREVRWLMEQEWVHTAEDIVWRRSKIGLRLSAEQINYLQQWIETKQKPQSP